ncbi:UNVERIFIED_CONTAM: hypothetical protein HDU68_009801 [Siphonaria sp. JEL0065]|nr:hypothetical protein HDU68_009801 [Siphonaria sp. JEL0065]
MSLFMTVYRYLPQSKDLYLILHLEDSTNSGKATIKNLKQQVEMLVKSLPDSTTSSTTAASSTRNTDTAAKADEKKEENAVEESEIKGGSSEDPTEAAGIRKRK